MLTHYLSYMTRLAPETICKNSWETPLLTSVGAHQCLITKILVDILESISSDIAAVFQPMKTFWTTKNWKNNYNAFVIKARMLQEKKNCILHISNILWQIFIVILQLYYLILFFVTWEYFSFLKGIVF